MGNRDYEISRWEKAVIPTAIRDAQKKRLTYDRLKRAFLLVDARHGLKALDEEILSLFRHQGVAHQVVLSKIDRVLFPKNKISQECMERNLPFLDETCGELRGKIQPGKADGPEALGEIICCSAETSIDKEKLGLGNLRWAVLAATGLNEDSSKTLSPRIFPNGSSHQI